MIFINKLEWHDGTPYSSQFQDVYFSSDNGLLETEYVFLEGNDLSNRWQSLNASTFTIVETGFGTGLNFLSAVKLWLATAPKHATLHFISLEKYPLSLPDMTTALALWPELNTISTALLAQYQTLLQATITLIDDRVQLTLLQGDALEQLQILAATQHKLNADAWFLDGFSPAKNPEMWQIPLFEAMATHSKTQATFATFTSAGAVKRGLIAAGFTVKKRVGFGKKREMLHGQLEGEK